MAKEIIHTPKAPAPVGPYHQAIRSGDTVYVSGQIALNPIKGSLLEASIAEETRLVMQHLQVILQAAGMTMEKVVKCSIFIMDMKDFAAINKVYAQFFDEDTAPARETVQVSHLPKGARVEISCIASNA